VKLHAKKPCWKIRRKAAICSQRNWKLCQQFENVTLLLYAYTSRKL